MEEPGQRHPAGSFRDHMREASKLLAQAGWKLQETIVDKTRTSAASSAASCAPSASPRRRRRTCCATPAGDVLTAEFLLDSPDFERIVLPYVQNLQKLGIKASVRMVDSAQYKRREDGHDYDIIVDTFAPVELARQRAARFLGLSRGRPDGSRNTAGIKNPAIDKLIDKIVFSTGPRRSRRRDARTRSRAAVELLRGAALALSFRAAGQLGHLRAPGRRCRRK